LQGLLGDVILASTYFDEIQRRYPGRRWIIVHSYRDPARVHAALDLLHPFLADGRIAAYVYHRLHDCVPMPAEIDRFFQRIRVEAVIQFMFSQMDRSGVTRPRLGIDLDRPKARKAVLMRRSTWNAHFPERNRPWVEWQHVEAAALDAGFDTYVVGVDDDMPITSGVIDKRHQTTPRSLLEFSADASLVVSCTTFLPVFTQFVCTSLVICDPRDYHAQLRSWRIDDRYVLFAAANYLPKLVDAIRAMP
jgi:hypothetical protein